jgi:hypothetical protein
MRESFSKINTLPKSEAPKKLDFTITGTASTMHETKPVPRASLSSLSSAGFQNNLNKLKQVSFQHLGDCPGDGNPQHSKSSSKSFLWPNQKTTFDRSLF